MDDQFGSPTSARMLAEVSAQVIAQGRGDMLGYLAEKAGLYHLAGSGSCSRYDWAREIVKLAGLDVTVEPAKTVDFPSPAIRPLHPILDCAKFTTAFNLALPGWRDALALLFAG